jgi:fermentation-respiration switch protein FrsA (DUF1100 family)
MFKSIAYIVVLLAVMIGYAKYVESKTVFFPSREMEITPEFIKLPYEEINLKTPDKLKINSWFIPATSRYTVLFCHGNAGNISTRLEKILVLHDFGLNVFIFDYRGYGKSQGGPSENGMYIDTKTAYDYLVNQRKINPEDIIIYGESLGGAAAINLAAKARNRGLIMEGVFSRAVDMARRLYPFLPPFLFSVKFDSLSKIKNIETPKLFIHSVDDGIVPIDLARKLYRAAKGEKYFVEIDGPHTTAFLDSKEKYIAAIKSFLARLQG